MVQIGRLLELGSLHGREHAFHVDPGDRIAQLVVAPVEAPELEESADLDATARGQGGFGSTGR